MNMRNGERPLPPPPPIGRVSVYRLGLCNASGILIFIFHVFSFGKSYPISSDVFKLSDYDDEDLTGYPPSTRKKRFQVIALMDD